MEHILFGDNIQIENVEEYEFDQKFHQSGQQIWYCDLCLPCSEMMLKLGHPKVGVDPQTRFERVGWTFKITRSFGNGDLKDRYYFYMYDNDFKPLLIKSKWILFSRSKRGINCFWRLMNNGAFNETSEQITYKITNPSIKMSIMPKTA